MLTARHTVADQTPRKAANLETERARLTTPSQSEGWGYVRSRQVFQNEARRWQALLRGDRGDGRPARRALRGSAREEQVPASPASTETEFPSLPGRTRPGERASGTPDRGDGPGSPAPRPGGPQQRENARVPARPRRPNLQLRALCAGRPPGARGRGPDNEPSGGRRPPLPAGPA